MELHVMAEPQEGATYDDLIRLARRCEELGFSGFFRSDHFQRIGEGDPGPGSTDAWTTLAGLARETSTLRLGTMVSSATFRRPGPLAITVATVDAMSGGRAELGLGSGWYEKEHTSYGIPFPSSSERFDRLEEQLEVITGLWATPLGSTYSFSGRHYTLTESPALPKPIQQPRPPVIVGGTGARRTPDLAARFADEFNAPPGADTETIARQYQRVREACEAAGRDPDSLRLSVVRSLVVGSEAEVSARLKELEWDPDNADSVGLCGTPTQVIDQIGRLEGMGAARVYLQMVELGDFDQLELMAEEVLPQLSSR